MANKKFSQFTSAPTPNANSFFVGYNSVTNDNVRTSLSDLITAIGAPSGSGTANIVPKWTDENTLGNSLFYSDANVAKTIYGGNDKGLKLDFVNNEAYFNNNNNIGIFSFGFGLYLGDWGGYQNATTLQILDDTRVIKTNDGGNDKGLYIDFADNFYALGDGNTTNNGSTFTIDDASQIIKTQNQGSDKGLYIDFTAYNNNALYDVNKINGSYQNFPNAVSVFYNTDYIDYFLNHNFYSNDGLSSLKFGQYLEGVPNAEGGGMLKIELDKGNWNQANNSILYWNNEEGFNLNNYNYIVLNSLNSNYSSSLKLYDYESSLYNQGVGYNFDLYLDTANQIIKTRSNLLDKGLYIKFDESLYSLGVNGGDPYFVSGFSRINQSYYMGDNANENGLILFSVLANDSVIKTSIGGSDRGLYFDLNNNIYSIGDGNTPSGFYANNNGETKIGDYLGNNYFTNLIVDDFTQIIRTRNQNADKGLFLDFNNNEYVFGGGSNDYPNLRIVNAEIAIGDVYSNNNFTQLLINDSNQIIKTSNNGLDRGLYIDFANNIYALGFTETGDFINDNIIGFSAKGFVFQMGEAGGISNKTYFEVDDTNQIIKTANNFADKGLYIDFANNFYALGFHEPGEPIDANFDGFQYQSYRTLIGANFSHDVSIGIMHLDNRIYLNAKRVNYKNLTTAQINALTGNQEGDVVYNSTLHTLCFYDGSGWRKVSHTNM